MPQGDDFTIHTPIVAPAPSPVDEPVVPENAPVESDESIAVEAVAVPETPEIIQAKRVDAAFAAQRRENERLAAEIAALKAGPLAPRPMAPPADAGAPKAEDYPTNSAFVLAMAEHAVQKIIAEREATQALTAASAAFVARETEFKQLHPDFDAVVAASDVLFAQPVLDAMQESEQGADILYFLGTHPEEAAKLAKLPVTAGLRALGRLEAKLEIGFVVGARAGATVKPAPMAPVGPAAKVMDTRRPDTLPPADFRVWWNKTYGR